MRGFGGGAAGANGAAINAVEIGAGGAAAAGGPVAVEAGLPATPVTAQFGAAPRQQPFTASMISAVVPQGELAASDTPLLGNTFCQRD